MSIDSFGFQVMSLRELQQELAVLAEQHPELLEQPVWTANMHPLHFPVRHVGRGRAGVQLVFERGGN